MSPQNKMTPKRTFFAAVITLVSVLTYVDPAAGSFDLNEIYYTVRDFLGFGGNLADVSRERELKSSASDMTLHLNNVTVVDYMKEGLPKVRIGHRVADLFNGWHFDDVLMDSPNEIRPASLVIFYNSSDPVCMRKYDALNYDNIAETKLPARSQLFTARYDMYSAPKRAWFEFTPEMDLEKRFAVNSCPQAIFVSRKCDGFTEWCEKGRDPEDPSLTLLGCENFVEHCIPEYRQTFSGTTAEQLINWVTEKLAEDGAPKLSRFLGSYDEQGRWLQKRDYTTGDNHFRNIFLAQAFPAFTKRGFKAMETPKEFQDWLLEFIKDHEKYRKTEHWNAESTQMSFHELPTTFIDMDRVRAKKEQMAVKYLQPILEEWSNIKPLVLTSFYGMREYHAGAWLKEHVDRIDTHVISITLSVGKRNFTKEEVEFLNEISWDGKKDQVLEEFNYKPWPLQVIDWTGQQVAYDHPPGTMILYESSKLPHGRPTRNEGGVHLGCFVHFKPIEMHAKAAKEWDDITAKARKNQNIHTEHARWRSTPEIEPEVPVFAEKKIGDESIWSHKKPKGDGKASDTDDDAQFQVEFRNRSDRRLQVFWYHADVPKPVLQGSVWPGASFTVNSYHGHTFYWAEENSEEPVAYGASFTIDVGKKVYEYSFKKDGTRNDKSKSEL